MSYPDAAWERAMTVQDVRIVAASNADLQDLVRQGQIRTDLFFRLNVVQLRLPPLRTRRVAEERLLEPVVARSMMKYDTLICL